MAVRRQAEAALQKTHSTPTFTQFLDKFWIVEVDRRRRAPDVIVRLRSSSDFPRIHRRLRAEVNTDETNQCGCGDHFGVDDSVPGIYCPSGPSGRTCKWGCGQLLQQHKHNRRAEFWFKFSVDIGYSIPASVV